MAVRHHASRADVGGNLPVFERLAPAPPAVLLAARIEAHTGPGDVVADLAGRGGWVARAAVDRQRRAISIESSPLTRMLAEVVLRPPDVRHLDAAFQGMSASPRGESSLKVSMGDLFATRCATCGRMLVADEFTWSSDGEAPSRPVQRTYRCTVCRDMRGGSEARHGALDLEDLERATKDPDGGNSRAWARDRFPAVDGAPDLVDELLDLHTPRQLLALTAIMERIEADLRAAPVLAALRLALLHALIPSSRLATGADAAARFVWPAATSGFRGRPSGASGTHGSRSRTGSARCVASSSTWRAARSGRSRLASARTCRRSPRGPRRPCSPSPVRPLSGP